MSRKMYGYTALLATGLLAMSLAGCGSDKKGSIAESNTGGVAKVDETLCAQCHGASVEKLTGQNIYADYTQSVHALNSVGCQDCHGGGAQHNGVGPIPFPKPNHEQCKTCHDSTAITSYPLVTEYVGSKHFNVQIELDAPCNRCHTHEGAVLAAKFGFTGDGAALAAGEAAGNAPGTLTEASPIKCNTCHVTHKPQDLRVDATWNPATVAGAAPAALTSNADRAQYRLCTQCHTYINPAGLVAGSGTTTSGTALVGHHDTSWYRAIATTHYDNPATSAIEGYGVRTTGANPCFDCHGHEATTGTRYGATTTPTIYTDWAQSGHALGLLTAKYAAATANPVLGSRGSAQNTTTGHAQVDAVMAASVPSGAFGGHNSGGCARCHTTEGFAYTMDNLATVPGTVPSGVLKCFGCHTNPGAGTLRTLKGAKATTNYTTDLGWNPTTYFTTTASGYNLNYGKKAYPDVAASNLCIECHDSRQNDPGAITTATADYTRTHYLQAATTMYVKMGFLNLSTGAQGFANVSSSAAYKNSLKSDQDGGSVTSTHRKLGTPGMIGDSHNPSFFVAGNLDSNGPCVTCHFAAKSHTLKIDQNTITAVCNKCHASEGGNDITTIAAFETHFLEPQAEAYLAALNLAIDVFNSKGLGVTLAPEAGTPFVRPYLTGTTTEAKDAALVTAGSSWVAVAAAGGYNRTKLFGAIGNIILFSGDQAAYAHARTYSRRLLYDTIDYLDDGVLNMSVGATAIARSLLPAGTSTSTTSTVSGLFGKGATAFTDSTLNTIATGTTEAMTYLIKWSRTDGTWSTPQRP